MTHASLIQRYRETAAAVVQELRRHPKVVGIAVCGSLASGELWDGSDIDLLAVMRTPEADWQALTVRHAGICVHLQLLSERLLLSRSDDLRGGIVSQLLSACELAYDPEHLLATAVSNLSEYPREEQVRNAVTHLLAFLGEYHTARKCLDIGYTEDAFLHTTIAFRELACAEFARCGHYNQRIVIENLPSISPHLYNAYVWFVHGRQGVGERIRRSFGFFERLLEHLLADIGPALISLIRSRKRPLTEEAFGEIPAICDRSANLTFLVERLIAQGLMRPDHRALILEGVPLTTLSEQLLDLF